MLVLENVINHICHICGQEAVSKLGDSSNDMKLKKAELALCSQCLEKLTKNIQNR